jgi:hypothetical protein
MNKLILKLAGQMLLEHESEIVNHGCNDLSKEVEEIIDLIPNDEIMQIIQDWNGGEPDEDNIAKYYDWIIAGAIGQYLIKLSEE